MLVQFEGSSVRAGPDSSLGRKSSSDGISVAPGVSPGSSREKHPSPVRGERNFASPVVPKLNYIARFAGLIRGVAFGPRAYARGYRHAARYRGLVGPFPFGCSSAALRLSGESFGSISSPQRTRKGAENFKLGPYQKLRSLCSLLTFGIYSSTS